MNTPINLNKVRKSRDKSLEKKVATENVAKFGRTKAERLLAATTNTHAAKMLDRHKCDDAQ